MRPVFTAFISSLVKNKVVTRLETIYPFPVTLSIPQACPAHEVRTMKSIRTKLLILLLVSALPNLAIAAESATGDQKKVPAAQTATQAATEATPKTPAPPTPKPADQPATTAAPPSATSPAAIVTPNAIKPQAPILIGYVDPIRVSTESETGKAGQAKLTEKKKKFQTQIEAKRKQLDKQRAAIEAKLPTFTPGQRESKAKEFQKKVEEYQKFLQKADEELQELQQDLSRELFEKIEQASTEYGKRNSLALVIVKRDLLYLADNVISQEITDGIVKLINEQGQKK